MKLFLLFITICTVLLSLAEGAFVCLVTRKVKSSNCTTADGIHAINCVLRLADFVEKMYELNMTDKTEVNEFEKSCTSLTSCLETTQCGLETQSDKKYVKMIKNYCDAVVYVSKDFADCSDKLENENSACYNNWNPFAGTLMDVKKDEKMLQEGCNNYFGEDNCLKKEITETCSETEWIAFRDHFVGISNIIMNCDFSNIQKKLPPILI